MANNNSIWKYVATVAVSVIIAGLPGFMLGRYMVPTEQIRQVSRDESKDIWRRIELLEKDNAGVKQELISIKVSLAEVLAELRHRQLRKEVNEE